MAGLLTGYYLYHKPMDVGLAAAFIRLVWTVLPACAVILVSAGVGSRLFDQPFRLHSLQSLERAFLQVALGFGCYSIAIMIAGLTIGHLRWVIWILTILPLPFVFRQIHAWWRSLSAIRSQWADAGLFARAVASLLVLICLTSLLVSLAPPVHYDALTYHLALPRTYLQTGSLLAGASWIRGAMPQTGEMLYTWAMSFGVESSASLLGWLAGMLALLALINFLQRKLSLSAACVGAGSILCGSGLAAALGWGYIDWFCLFFGLAALIAFSEWLDSKASAWMLLCGLACGLAFTSKYTGGVILAGFVVVLLIESLQTKSIRWRDALLLAGGFVLAALPWLVKNLVLAGNPLAPYFSGSAAIPAARQQVIQGRAPFGNWMDILLLPFRATLIGADGGQGYSHTIGVLFLLLGGLAWVAPVRPESKKWLRLNAILAAVTIVLWVIGNRFSGLLVQNRMYYAAFPVFACLAAAGYEELAGLKIPQVRMGRLVGVIVLLVLGLNTVELTRDLIRSQTVPYLAGVVSGQNFREQNQGWYARAIQAVHDSGAQTLLIYEPRGLACLPGCQPDEILDRWSYDFHRLGSCEAVTADWQSQGFKQALVYQTGVDFFLKENDPNHQKSDLLALQACMKTLPVKQDFGGMYELVSLEK
jgi:4-amino-4-deoxy-L-arabinose transferase-like glycosyltransferase